MKFDNAELRDKLAAEYVLGTLRGRARRRFERQLAADASLAETVERWEMRLNALAEALPPVEPPARLWPAIEHALGPQRTGALEGRSRQLGLWRSLGFWRGFGLAVSALAAALVIYIALTPPAPRPAPLAVIEDQVGHAAFLAFLEPATQQLALTTVAAAAPAPGRSYELWLLPKGGAAPRPLGLLPAAGPAVFTLAPVDAAALSSAQGLAISLEPAGGSPTGLPTGPVLFKGALFGAG